MFKWLKKRLGLEPQPLDPDFGSRIGKAMGPIVTDAIKADRITATEIKAAHDSMADFPIIQPSVILVKASELEKLVDEAEEIVDMMFRGAETAPCRRAAKEHADSMQEFVDKLRKHRIIMLMEK